MTQCPRQGCTRYIRHHCNGPFCKLTCWLFRYCFTRPWTGSCLSCNMWLDLRLPMPRLSQSIVTNADNTCTDCSVLGTRLHLFSSMWSRSICPEQLGRHQLSIEMPLRSSEPASKPSHWPVWSLPPQRSIYLL